MIVGYDLASYSYGSGPCMPPTMGWIATEAMEEADVQTVMREIMRRAFHASHAHPRVTSIVATLHWGDGETLRMRAGLIDRNEPEAAPYPHQTEAMAAFAENVWVGTEEPTWLIRGEKR